MVEEVEGEAVESKGGKPVGGLTWRGTYLNTVTSGGGRLLVLAPQRSGGPGGVAVCPLPGTVHMYVYMYFVRIR